jgi:class 3 adenylate cyclase/tetratricopeptide (TPR) repeat protein
VDIAAWLRSVGLEHLEQVFRDNAIDLEVLPELTDEHLKEMGIPLGHRLKLQKAIAGMSQGAVAGQRPPAATALVPLSAAAGERRQVAVLFADLAGFTALSKEVDAEEVHALLGLFFDRVDRVVEEYGGHIDKHIGDCVMAVFGAPVAHGNDAERAVRAALAICDAMPELSVEAGRTIHVHIGIAGGQVVASGTGSASHREYTVTGETVNLASRLTDAAATGEILISDNLWDAVSNRFEATDAGTLAVKGLGEQIRVWQVRAIRTIGTAARAPFVGRHAELQQFNAAMVTCLETGSGQAVYVRGDAGIGKTRLVEEFQHIARQAGFACHHGLVLDFGAGTGRDAIGMMVRSLLGLDAVGDLETSRAAVEAALARGHVPADEVVFLNHLLGLPQPQEVQAVYEAMDSSTRYEGTQRTVVHLVEHGSRLQPRVLVIEDVHWADPPLLTNLANLAAAVVECPVLLIMTSRLEGDPLDREWRGRTAGAPLMTIDVGPLRRAEAMVLAGGIINAVGRFSEQCVERAAGNPLFLEQLLRLAEENAAATVPGSIRSLMQARLDRLDASDKVTVQAASVLGQRFGRGALAHLLDQPDCAPERLVAHFLVRPEGNEFLFAHALIRDAVYDTLLKSRRRELHGRAADWFVERDPVLHAQHLDRAEHPEAPRAYLRASMREAAAYRHDAAASMIERGLALSKDPADVFALTCTRGELLHDLGRMADSISAHRRALEIATGDEERCRALIGLAAGLRITDRYDEAFVALDEAESAAKRAGFTVELARIHHLRGNLCFPLGRLDECLRQHEHALEYAQQGGSPELEARALGGLGDAHFAACRMVSAYGYFDRCIEIARAHNFVRVEVVNVSMQAHILTYLNRLGEGLRYGNDAVDLAVRVGDRRAEMLARRTVGSMFLEYGELDRAQTYHEEALELARQLGARRFEAPCLTGIGKILALRGERSAAHEVLAQAGTISRQTGIKFTGAIVFGATAVSADTTEARRGALAEGEAILNTGVIGMNYLWFYRDAMEASLAAGWWDEVERYATALEDYMRREPVPWSDLFIRRGRALAAFGRGQSDETLRVDLERLRDQALGLGFKLAVPALDEALLRYGDAGRDRAPAA